MHKIAQINDTDHYRSIKHSGYAISLQFWYPPVYVYDNSAMRPSFCRKRKIVCTVLYLFILKSNFVKEMWQVGLTEGENAGRIRIRIELCHAHVI